MNKINKGLLMIITCIIVIALGGCSSKTNIKMILEVKMDI